MGIRNPVPVITIPVPAVDPMFGETAVMVGAGPDGTTGAGVGDGAVGCVGDAER
jgi:hypothetical protein